MKLVDAVKLDRNEVDKVIGDAKERDFESVIIFGLKDGIISIICSGVRDKIKILGALEAAKQHLWNAPE